MRSVGIARSLPVRGSLVSATAPVIVVVGGLAPFDAAAGVPTAEQTYTIAATNLTGDLTISLPAAYEIALVGGAFQSGISLTPTAGTVPPTTVRVRYVLTGNGRRWGDIVHTSPGAADQATPLIIRSMVLASARKGLVSDLWSSADGINWVQEARPPWRARFKHTLAAFNDEIFMLGGAHLGGSGLTWGQSIPLAAEVWSTELPAIQHAAAAYSVTENSGQVTLRVELNRTYGYDVSVDFATLDGTATAPGDYAAASGTVTVPAGQTGADITITINDDQLDEPDEALQVVLSNPRYATLGLQTATVQILDDDGVPNVRFGASAYLAPESAGGVSIEIRLSNISGFDVQVDYATADLTANAGLDYSAATGTAVILAGQVSVTILVQVSADNIFEGDERFSIALSSPVNAGLGAMSTTEVTIVDDDTMPSVGFALSALSVAETVGSVSVEIRLSNPTSQTVTVDYGFLGGTAEAGVDFSDMPGTVTFNPGEISQQIVIGIIDDARDERAETFQVTLNGPVGGTLGPTSVLKVTILRDPEGAAAGNATGCTSMGSSGTLWLVPFLLGAGGLMMRRRRRAVARNRRPVA